MEVLKAGLPTVVRYIRRWHVIRDLPMEGPREEKESDVTVWGAGNCLLVVLATPDPAVTQIELRTYQGYPPDSKACNVWNSILTQCVQIGWLSDFEHKDGQEYERQKELDSYWAKEIELHDADPDGYENLWIREQFVDAYSDYQAEKWFEPFIFGTNHPARPDKDETEYMESARHDIVADWHKHLNGMQAAREGLGKRAATSYKTWEEAANHLLDYLEALDDNYWSDLGNRQAAQPTPTGAADTSQPAASAAIGETFETRFKGTVANFLAVVDDLESRLTAEGVKGRVFVVMPHERADLVYVRFGQGEVVEHDAGIITFGEIMARAVANGVKLRVWFSTGQENRARRWWERLRNRMAEDGWLDTPPTTSTPRSELIFNGTPARFGLLVRGLKQQIREKSSTLEWMIDRDPFTIYPVTLPPDVQSVDVTFGDPNSEDTAICGHVTAQSLPDGKALLIVSAEKESWPSLTQWWKLIRAEAERLGFLDAQPVAGAALDNGQGKEKSADGVLTVEYRAKLRQNLAEHFSKDELRTLAFDIGLQHENLPDALDGMARELVAYCERTGRIRALVAECRKRRPNASWEAE